MDKNLWPKFADEEYFKTISRLNEAKFAKEICDQVNEILKDIKWMA